MFDPDNRLVAESLEGEWNTKLHALAEAQDHYKRQRETDRSVLDEAARAKLLALANDLRARWRDPETPDRERKRLRLLVEDVTLVKGKEIVAQVRFRGGPTQTLTQLRPLPAWSCGRSIRSSSLRSIDPLINEHTDAENAAILSQRRVRTYVGTIPHRTMIGSLRHDYGLKSQFQRLREAGLLTCDEMAKCSTSISRR